MSGRDAPEPVRRPLALQTWSDVAFLHWRTNARAIQEQLPPGLRLDVIDGTAWVTAVPFHMRRVRAPGLPPVPGWSDFPELNLRTYVRGPDGRDGVFLLGLLCPRRLIVAGLTAAGLPGRYAIGKVSADGATRTYRFARRHDPRGRPAFGARIVVGPALREEERTPLVDALTGRWNGYARTRGHHLVRLPVEHEPWPLHEATLTSRHWSPAALGLPPSLGEPLVHFSPEVSSRLGAPVVIGRAQSPA